MRRRGQGTRGELTALIRLLFYTATEKLMETPTALPKTHYVPDLYFIFQHEKLGTFKVAQKLQELYRSGELPAGLGDVSRLMLTFDQRRALRYTARERVIAFRKVLGYNLFF